MDRTELHPRSLGGTASEISLVIDGRALVVRSTLGGSFAGETDNGEATVDRG